MSNPDEEAENPDELDLKIRVADGLDPARAARWPDFEAALDDEEPQPQPGDFYDPEPSEYEEW